MVVGNEGEMPLYNGKGKNLHSARSGSSGQQQLQMQFDAWMNNLNIAKVPENVSKEMLAKGKGKAGGNTSGATETKLDNTKSSIPIPTPHPMQQLGSSSVQETRLSSTQLEHNQGAPKIENSSTPISSTYPKDQSGVAFAPKTFNGQTYVPSQVNPGCGFSQEYPPLNYGYDMTQDYQLWQHPPIPRQQVESNASSGKFANESCNTAQNYQFDTSQISSNHVTTNFAEGNNYQGSNIQHETPEKTPVNPNQMQNTDLPNMVFNNNGNSNKEGNYEDGNGSNNKNTENNDMDDDVMIISPPPSVQVPPSSSGVSSDLNDIFPSLDPLGDDVPWTQKIQDTPIWEWDDLYFP